MSESVRACASVRPVCGGGVRVCEWGSESERVRVCVRVRVRVCESTSESV